MNDHPASGPVVGLAANRSTWSGARTAPTLAAVLLTACWLWSLNARGPSCLFPRTSSRDRGRMATDGRFEARVDGSYRLAFIAESVEFTADRLRWDRDELVGQLAVFTGLPGARVVDDGCVSIGSFNFSAPRTRQERAKSIAERLRAGGKIDVLAMLEELCQRTLRAERRGQPSVALRDVPKPSPDAEHDVDGLRFPKHHPTYIFGDGGTGKSLTVLRAGGVLATRGLRVGLFDWELDEGTQRLRLEELFGPDMPDIRYVRCDRPLVYEVDRVRRIVSDDRLEYGLFDSIGYACAGPPEAAEHAMGYARAVRQLGIGSLHVAHVRQGEGNDQRPFGSSFWHNSARATWFTKLAATASDRRSMSIGLFNRKSNLTALRPAVGYEIAFDAGRTVFSRINIADVHDLADSLPMWQRLQQALRTGPQTLARLAEDLGANVETLDRTVRRKSGLFTRVPSKDGISRIALLETRVA
jgi:hypothetical protein